MSNLLEGDAVNAVRNSPETNEVREEQKDVQYDVHCVVQL